MEAILKRLAVEQAVGEDVGKILNFFMNSPGVEQIYSRSPAEASQTQKTEANATPATQPTNPQ